jgi:tetratricopeptide (TPR) repeat protein
VESIPDASHRSAYFTGLQSADPAVLSEIKATFHRGVVQAVERAGGSFADGEVFYKTALATLLNLAEPPAQDAWRLTLEALAVAQFQSWLRERGQTPMVEAPAQDVPVPDDAALRQARQRIAVWNQLLKMSHEARLTAIAVLGESWDDASVAAALGQRPAQFAARKPQYLAELRDGLRLPEGEWPDWVSAALGDAQGWALWQALHTPEQEDAPASGAKKNAARILFFLLLAATLGYMAYVYWWGPKSAEQVFQEQFAPPESLVADQRARYGGALGNDSVSARPNQCTRMIREADGFYKKKRWEEAQDALLLIALDPSENSCRNDAWFYLGLIRLKLDDPQTALECFVKIDNLEQFGEEVYWYQALCFVKLSAQDSDLRPTAVRAIQRLLEQTQDPKRRAEAEKMLEELSE